MLQIRGNIPPRRGQDSAARPTTALYLQGKLLNNMAHDKSPTVYATMTPPYPASCAPRISLIIPIYNVAAHVRACIHSVTAQTLTDFEVLLIDDGATDGSGDIALEAAGGDLRFRLIRQDNAGLGGARNTGLAAAKGEFIAFVDSDDTLMPDYLMRLWQTLEQTGGDWVACAIQSTNADGTGERHSAIHGQVDLALHGTARRYTFHNWSDVIAHFPSAWNKLYRRSLIEGLRFDEGTWFEDHGFFQRAAARTDHIIHLPEALYVQTRGRAGQITSQDDERVFEQFDVLETMQHQFAQGAHAHPREALARIASRLVFERSTIIADPDRRARFATAARDWLATQALNYNTDWDTDIGLSWGLEMAGTLPLSVILSWDGADMAALANSLDALRHQSAPGHEVLIICQTGAARRSAQTLEMPAHWHLHTAPRGAKEGAAFNHGLTLARGAYVVFIQTGDAATPWSLLHTTEAMMRDEADFGITQMRLHHLDAEPNSPQGTPDKITYHNGIHDMALWPNGPPMAGPQAMTPLQALGLEAHSSAKIFRRQFLTDSGLAFTDGPRSDWALCLNAALMAPVTTYIAQASVTITLRDQGFERWHLPLGAPALMRGHKALLNTVTRALPAPLLAALPQGWQRKLFARALREQVYFGDYPSGARGRLAKAMMVARAAITAGWHGYGKARAAGLDPFVGPRLARILNPRSVAWRKLRRSAHAPDTAADPNAKAPDDLHAFDLKHHGMITLRAEFREAPYANIYFRAAPRGPVLFHISLRHAEGQAICNNQSATGQWRNEKVCAVNLSAGFADVVITFDLNHVTVALNGHEIFHFGSSKLTRTARFTNLDAITGFDCEGDIRPAQIIPQIPDAPLLFDSRLTLWAATAEPSAVLRETSTGTVLPVISAPLGTTTALLPARLWHDLSTQEDLTLELMQGPDTTTITITRDDIAARIEALLVLPLALSDSIICLTLLEHVRYAGLADRLSPAARHRLDKIATFYNVQDFLYADVSAAPPSESTASVPISDFAADPIAREVASAMARIAQSQTADPAHRPDPLDILDALHVSPQAAPLLFLSLAEFFCSEERDFEGLYQIAHRRNVLPLEGPKTRWAMSATLPFDMVARQYDRVCENLLSLVPPHDDWLVTAGIGWTVRRGIVQANTPALVRYKLFDAFRQLIYKRADNYWDRMQCRELTRTAATLIVYRHRLEPKQQQDAVALCLRVYGLSRQFWADLENTADLPAELRNARTAFGSLMSPDSPPQDRIHALQLFENAKAIDAPRLRREMFGPAGLPRLTPQHINSDTDPIDIPDLMQMKATPSQSLGQAALRHMASPGGAPVTPAIADLAHAALPALYTRTSRAPYFETQQTLTRNLQDLLHDQSNAKDADMTTVIDNLAQLADAGSSYLGLGMALALIDRLHDTAPAQVQELCDWIHTQIDTSTGAQPDQGWRKAPALVQPLRRLHQRINLLPAVQHLIDTLAINATPAQAPDNSGLPAGNPLFDTLVTVFSCIPYLEDRIPAMRAGWLGLLEDLGVPYVIVVGNGDGTLRGDVLHLDAPDDYEGLPQKTLATVRWVHDNTRFGHMLKIDDDCFLNAPLFFGALSYRKFDYYGRRLLRSPGQMDRKWHQSKSSSLRGQLDLDKSPEPSEYADGGTGYTLSRTAMSAALHAATTQQGQHLIAVSFMEDKLLGDLLALYGIRPNDEDYRISMRRRTYSAATPVALWHNSFFASQTAAVQLVHLDTHAGQLEAVARLKTPSLWPRKIWPSYQDVKLGYQSNALELISSEASVAHACAADVAVVACMRNEMFMLPHFLSHYRKLGVDAFLIADNCSDDGTLEYLQQQPDVTLFSVDTDYNLSRYGVAWQQAMMSAFRSGKWSLVADADELLVWQEKQTQTLGDLLKSSDFQHANAARVFMLDMYPEGPLEQADFSTGTPFDQARFADRIPFLTNTLSRGPYSNQPSWTSALRHRLITGSTPSLFVAQKLALLRYQPWMRLSAGLHFVNGVDIAPRELLFAHFKYNADFRRKAQAEVQRGQHFNNAEEYRKYLALTSEGRSLIHDPDLSAVWTDVSFVKDRLS